TGRMLIEIEKVLLEEKPDIVLVYGDTNSTLAGALSAVKLKIPVAHVEAGLRSFNMAMPEEINRILTDRISSILFCPTDTAVQNLLNEGFKVPNPKRSTIHDPLVLNVGDVMNDVALYHGTQVTEKGGILSSLANSHGIISGNYCLATIHRAENTDNPERLKNIFAALCEFSKEVSVILPIHPRTRKILGYADSQTTIHNSLSLILIDPVGYLDMVQLEKYAALIATDSGGVQKEAFFHQVPCVTLRDETEWVELVEAGWNRLAPPVNVNIVLSALRKSIGSFGKNIKPYGGGDAANLIVDQLIRQI
ncbi:MAG: UDP-N-acetylglucosamine 2-epimerase (non-hydrolyzing), partial [Desulfuromonadaceae bacterium]|nr:UDP-N-acetylglucosamine 2-epimerase (non-hydrolyzing) [Desulfuromonadaceae bacterium]